MQCCFEVVLFVEADVNSLSIGHPYGISGLKSIVGCITPKVQLVITVNKIGKLGLENKVRYR